ncbi:uncharacterized protein [Aegilops tauschii subsp. strangulata]|uniref:uncharacterized protein n=1 Tax=Aegilops tauschii subsp. strangulata TaxID=200361 RepID=UPI003CC8DD88
MMSLLSFKEAVRMSLLSSQWRHLWRSCIRDLVFTRELLQGCLARVGSFLERAEAALSRLSLAPAMLQTSLTPHSPCAAGICSAEERGRSYMAPSPFVLETIHPRCLPPILCCLPLRASPLPCLWLWYCRSCPSLGSYLDPTTPRDKFVLEFKLINTNVQPQVDRWVTFCAASRAKHIVFNFKPGSWGKHDNSFSFPLHLFVDGAPAVRSLCLMSAYLNPLPGFCGFTNLRKLKLDSVSGDIQCLLLPACSMLEWLSIVGCTLRSLTASQPLPQLRYLCVHYCYDVHKLEEVTIKFPTWRSDLFDYAFADHGMANVPKLSVELAIDAEFVMVVCAYVMQVPGCAKCPSKFVNLKHLILSVDVLARDSRTSGILRLACLLELSPVLKHLELHVRDPSLSCLSAVII